MSKSLGNGIDPMDVIDMYGADSLRFFLTTNTAPGMDLRYDEDKVKSTWNFINKIWNASRFVLMKLEDFKEEDYTLDNLKEEDKWILDRLNTTIKDVTKNKMNELWGTDFDLNTSCFVEDKNCYNTANKMLETSINDGSILYFVNDNGNLNILVVPYADFVQDGNINRYLIEVAK